LTKNIQISKKERKHHAIKAYKRHGGKTHFLTELRIDIRRHFRISASTKSNERSGRKQGEWERTNITTEARKEGRQLQIDKYFPKASAAVVSNATRNIRVVCSNFRTSSNADH
jgi:hypothetical protein